ncbi:MAG: hypothetical protein ACKO83_04475, partial [Roseiflexaceae bacterium]
MRQLRICVFLCVLLSIVACGAPAAQTPPHHTPAPDNQSPPLQFTSTPGTPNNPGPNNPGPNNPNNPGPNNPRPTNPGPNNPGPNNPNNPGPNNPNNPDPNNPGPNNPNNPGPNNGQEVVAVETGKSYKQTTEMPQGALVTGQPATIVLNAFGFNQSGGPLSFNHPAGIHSDGTHLFVADRGNNRVLIWNTLPKTNVAP